MVQFKTKLKYRYALQRMNSYARNKYLYALILIVLILALAGSLTGFSTYIYQYSKSSGDLSSCNDQLNSTQFVYTQCTDELNVAQTNSTQCTKDLKNVNASLRLNQIQLSACMNVVATNLSGCLDQRQKLFDDNNKLSGLLSNCTLSLWNLNQTLNNTQKNLDQLKENYNAVVENAAKYLCCIQKITNPNLSYYYVVNNTILCTVKFDENLGTKAFSC